MSDYPLIKELGLNITLRQINRRTDMIDTVRASDLEAVLARGRTVYNSQDDGYGHWCVRQRCNDSHKALLINIQLLKPKTVEVTKESLAKAWDGMAKTHTTFAANDISACFKEFCKELGL